MSSWFMLTVVGQDQKGIVADITETLFELNCQLGETSMIRLGGNFTMMCMVQFQGDQVALESALEPHTTKLGLKMHVDKIDAHLHEHQIPNIRISMHGADRPGMVASVTNKLKTLDFNIIELESDVGGSEQNPIFIMHLEGYTNVDVQTVQDLLAELIDKGMDISVSEIETMLG